MTRLPGECEDACCCVLNFLEKIDLIGWESIKKSITVVKMRSDEWMNDLFSSITTKIFTNPADVSKLKCWRTDDTGDVWFQSPVSESKIAPRFQAWDTVAIDESPTLICSMLILDNCWCETNSRNSVLLSLSFKKFDFIHWRILFMQSSIVAIVEFVCYAHLLKELWLYLEIWMDQS